MYKNIFICLAFAIVIDGCWGGIRIKRIAETRTLNEKKVSEAASSAVPADLTSKVSADESSGDLLKDHVLNSKRSTVDHDANIVAHLAEDLKRHTRTSLSRDLSKEHLSGLSDEGDDVKLNKEKENLGTEVDGKVSAGLKDDKVDIGSQHREEQGGRLERSMGDRTQIRLSGDNSDLKARHDRKAASKRDSRNVGSLTASSHAGGLVTTGSDNHRAIHDGNEGDSIKKLIEDVKLEGHKKELNPDVDVYLYGNMPAKYESHPVLFEMFNTKQALMPTSFEHYYPPHKWVQRRSPMQSALEIANMMVKVGLDELENEDYGEHVPFTLDASLANKGSGHKLERSFTSGAGFCPVHTKKVTFSGEMGDLGESSSRYGDKLEEPIRIKRDHPPEMKSMNFLKPF